MTINTTTARVDYLANGTTTSFPVTFPFFGAGELLVIERLVSTGAETTLALSTHYTVSGGQGSTGTVTAVSAPAAGRQWTILRATARTQLVDYGSNDPFPAETHERALDRLTAIMQEVAQDAAQSIRLPRSEAPPPALLAAAARANKLLGFDSGGALAIYSALDRSADTILAAGSTVARSSAERAGEVANPHDFGALGDGVADDTSALVAAIATGKDVDLVPGKTYKHTDTLSLTTSYQRLGGGGILKPVGAFDAVSVGGAANGCELDLTMDAAGHTGHALNISNANRVRVRRLHLLAGDKVAYVQQANTVTFDWVYASNLRGTYGYKWFGNATYRSDVLSFGFSLISFGSGVYGDGLIWDGNCNSLTILYFGVVSPGYGLRILNTAGDGAPNISRIYDLEVDYPNLDGVRVEAGTDHELIGVYCQGSATGSGLYVASGVAADAVRVLGGKFTGNARYGIETSPRVRMGNSLLSSNTLGEVSGTVAFTGKRFEVAANGYFDMLGTDGPQVVWDASDYDTFRRSDNRRRFIVGGTEVLGFDGANIDASLPLRVKGYTVGTLPSAAASVRGLAYVSDGTSNKRQAISDGANWRWPDGAVVS